MSLHEVSSLSLSDLRLHPLLGGVFITLILLTDSGKFILDWAGRESSSGEYTSSVLYTITVYRSVVNITLVVI